MTQIDINGITSRNKTDYDLITQYNLGSLLLAGDGCLTNDGNLQSDPDKDG
jgi:hypothetical protein